MAIPHDLLNGLSEEEKAVQQELDKLPLRKLVSENQVCLEKFHEAFKLAVNKFKLEKHVALPYFTPHGIDHCARLEIFLNKIIWRNEKLGDQDFIPSPEEAMYLLSSVWLHDIGMMYGILDNEKPQDLQDVQLKFEVREEHEVRSVRYIVDHWNLCGNWTPDEKELLANICLYHRKKYDIASFDPVYEKSSLGFEDSRLAVLAALLRLADACHVDCTRSPAALMNFYLSIGISEDHAVHWNRAGLITDVIFDHANRNIVISSRCPAKHDFFGGYFDLQEVVNIVKDGILEELKSVQSILLPWSNIFFTNVTSSNRSIRALEFRSKELFLSLWPYLLQTPCSSTEAASSLIQMLKFSLNSSNKNYISETRSIVEKIHDSRPFDFMIDSIYRKIIEWADETPVGSTHCSKMHRELTEQQRMITSNFESIVKEAISCIDENDYLFIFGHSLNIEELLIRLPSKIKLYIIDCFSPISDTAKSSENIKVTNIAKTAGFDSEDIKFIQLYSFPSILRMLIKNKDVQSPSNIKLLLGTHGICKNGDILSKVGSELITMTAKRYGAMVIALSSKSKIIPDDVNVDTLLGSERLLSTGIYKINPDLSIPFIEPKMDVVTKDMLDVLLTQDGNLLESVEDTTNSVLPKSELSELKN